MSAKIFSSQPKKNKEDIGELYKDIGQPRFQKPSSPPRYLIFFFLAFLAGVFGGILGYIILSSQLINLPFLAETNSENANKPTVILEKPKEESLSREVINDLVNKISPQIVNIYKAKSEGTVLEKIYSEAEKLGQGIILTSDGWIITNKEVVSNLEESYVAVTGGKEILEQEKITSDPLTGLVFLKVKGENLSPVEFADFSGLYLSQEVFSFFLLENSSGNLNLSRLISLEAEPGESRQTLVKSSEELQEQLLVSPEIPLDYKGTALFSQEKKVVGFSLPSNGEKIEAFIPAHFVESVLVHLLENGNISRPYLGIHYLDISETINLDQSLSQGQKKGILIYGDEEKPALVKGSPADTGGLKAEDIITKINNVEIENGRHFNQLIAGSKDQELEFTVLRGTEEKIILVTLEEK